MKIGILFPGQGSQYQGMGRGLYDEQPLVREYFQRARAQIGCDVRALCFDTSDELLRTTLNAQLSLFVLSSALYQALIARTGLAPVLVAGHSSGEYAALCAAGAFTFEHGMQLIQARAQVLEQATLTHEGTMRAILGLSSAVVEQLCDRYNTPDDLTQVAQVANYNAPTQHIISGTNANLDLVAADAKALGARVLPLAVAGAFHSRLMQQAAAAFVPTLRAVNFQQLTVPVIANLHGRPVKSADEILSVLEPQMSSAVLWWQSMQHFARCDLIIQVGPGAVLAKMLAREWPQKQIVSFSEPSDWLQLEKVLA